MSHLDTHSWYSFHLGVARPEELAYEAAQMGYGALGVCDVDGTYGLVNFYKAAVKVGIKPVLGVALTAAVTHHARRGGPPCPSGIVDDGPAQGPAPAGTAERENAGSLRVTDKSWHAADIKRGVTGVPLQSDALVLARDRTGYTQLCELATGRQLDPGWDMRRALAAADRCFVITDREELLRYLTPRLGPDQLFVRLLAEYGPAYRAEQIRQARLAQRYRLHTCACTDVCFVRPQDQPVHHLLRAIGGNTSLHLAGGVRCRNHYLAAPTEMGGLFYNFPEALATAQRITDRCDVELILGQWHFPEFPFPGTAAPASVLRELCLRGLQWRYKGAQGGEHMARLDMELAVIDKLGYSSYFLFVRDIVRESARRGIPCLGRGSAANSLVSYVLGLTPVDPLRYNMYFERFLNPDRTSPPDIDIDFNWRRRDEIIQYVYDRWGAERVALISTHVTYRAKSALRETAKVFGLSDREISQLSRYLPGMNAGKLTGSMRAYPELQGIDFTVEPYKHVLPLAAQLAGKPRHLGIHCGGIVIAPREVTDFSGLQRAAKGFVVTQYEMHGVEAIGLIKIDLLGNRSLGVFEDAVAVLRGRGIDPPLFNLHTLTTDLETRSMLREGRTMGCFYMESPAMRALLARLKTDSYMGLTAASSVIRPGVAESGMMQEYIRRHNGLERKLPSHPVLDELLPETHGVMVYQEDVIRVAHEVAGFTPSQADILRRSMSGKMRSADAMNELRESFLEGCVRKGRVDAGSALEVWRQLSSFSGYSFCKAHSASFATLSYQVGWLKAHYPAELMAAVLSNGGGFYGAQAYLSECRRLGLAVLPPDVNESEYGYTAAVARPSLAAVTEAATEGRPTERQNAVRIGLGIIKGLPGELLQRIAFEARRGGRFADLVDFRRRIRPHRKELETLILCGALDSLGKSRPELLWQAGLLERVQSTECRVRGADRSTANLALCTLHPVQAAVDSELLVDYSAAKMLQLELEHFGMVISRFPLDAYPALPRQGVTNAVDIHRHAGRRVRLLGWCIATKRVNLDPNKRKGAPDPLALHAAEEIDEPDDPWAEEDEQENAAVDIGLLARSPGWKRKGESSWIHAGATYAMKFMSMEDSTGTYEVTLFPQAYAKYAPLTRFAGPFVVHGSVDDQFGVCTITCDRLELLDVDLAAQAPRIAY